MKNFKKKTQQQQPMSNTHLSVTDVVETRIAVFDNNADQAPAYAQGRYVAEVDFKFKNGTEMKLRQNLGTYDNHCYRVPTTDIDYNPWYEMVYAEAKELDKTSVCVHGKLGRRQQNPNNPKQFKYMNIPGAFITYDINEHMAHLYVTEPVLDADNEIDLFSESVDLHETLDQTNNNGLRWTLMS